MPVAGPLALKTTAVCPAAGRRFFRESGDYGKRHVYVDESARGFLCCPGLLVLSGRSAKKRQHQNYRGVFVERHGITCALFRRPLSSVSSAPLRPPMVASTAAP